MALHPVLDFIHFCCGAESSGFEGLPSNGWLGSLVVTALDLRLDGREFNSRPWRCRVTTLGKLFTPMCLCHKAV